MKVLVIRFSSIGDIVLTSPVVRCLHKQLNAEVHYLTKERFAPLLTSNPYISKIHILEDEPKAELYKIGFDVVVDLHKNLRSLKFRNVPGAKVYSFNKSNIRKWVLVNISRNILNGTDHIVDRYFQGLEELHLVNDGMGLDFFLDQEKEDHTLSALPIKEYYVLVLGANYFTKRIPLKKCEEIIKNQKLHCILIGGDDAIERAKTLNNIFPEKAINLAGQLNFHESAAIIKDARYVVTGDTGMMHIAAAFHKTMFVLWGNTVKEFGMYPYYGEKSKAKAINLEVNGLSCRPCSKLGYQKCPKSHFKCMLDQDTSQIKFD